MRSNVLPSLYLSEPAIFTGEAEHSIDELSFDLPQCNALREVGVSRYRSSNLDAVEMVRRALPKGLGDLAISHVLLLTSRLRWPDGVEAFSTGRFIEEIGLGSAEVWGLGLTQCSGLHSAVQLASALVQGGRAEAVLVACVETAGPQDNRLVFAGTSVHSDAAATFILSSEPVGATSLKVLASESFTAPALSRIDPIRQLNRYMADYSDGCSQVARACARAAGRDLDEFRWLVLNNYNNRVNRGVAELLGFSWTDVGSVMAATQDLGHALSVDNLINLAALLNFGHTSRGDGILMLGTGPNRWGATALEVM